MADPTELDALLGLKYSGEISNGRMESEEPAQYEFESGTVYNGPFKNGCFHGEGKFECLSAFFKGFSRPAANLKLLIYSVCFVSLLFVRFTHLFEFNQC